MLFVLFSICTVFFGENFTKLATNNWDESQIGTAQLKTCSASHPKLPHNCVTLNNSETESVLTTKVESFTAAPLLVSFTVKSTFPSTGSSAEIVLLNAENPVYSISFGFQKEAKFAFKSASKQIATGILEHEAVLSHSVIVTVTRRGEYTLFIDGMALSAGEIPNFKVQNVNRVKLSLVSGAGSLEVGNVMISDELDSKWKIVTSTVLRYRRMERALVRKAIVDAEEERLFGRKLKGKLDWLEEEGDLLEEDACDPGKFSFPFKINTRRAEDEQISNDPISLAKDLFDDEDERVIEDEEIGEDDFGFDEMEESEL